MEKVLLISQIGEKREFKGNDGSNITARDIVLTDGQNTFIASAFDKTVQRMEDQGIQVGTLVNANLSFYTTTSKSDKGEFTSQRVRLEGVGILVLP